MPIPPRRPPEAATSTNHETPYIFIEVKSSLSEDDIHHERISLDEVGRLLVKLERSPYKEQHELLMPNHKKLVGYNAIQKFYREQVVNTVFGERIMKGKNMGTSGTYTFVEMKNADDYGNFYHYELTLADVRELLKTLKRSAYNHLHELHGPDNLYLVGYSSIQEYCYGNTGTKMNNNVFTFEEGTLSGAYIYPNLTIQKVGSLLEDLKYNKFKEKHKLHLPHGFTFVGYDAIKQYYKQSTELPKTEDHILNPVLKQPIQTDFIREVDIMRLVTEIQSLATKPGNENKIHELSTVLKYVMEPECTPSKEKKQKRQEILYDVKFLNGCYFNNAQVLACDEDEALDMFRALKLPYTDIIAIAKRK